MRATYFTSLSVPSHMTLSDYEITYSIFQMPKIINKNKSKLSQCLKKKTFMESMVPGPPRYVRFMHRNFRSGILDALMDLLLPN